jgi:pimeloyl-ACP methyl ester carboxylesterase
MTTFGYDGFQLAFEERGRRDSANRPIVLVHGLLFDRKHHYSLADALADRGNRVILIDLLGHGESDKPRHSRHYTMEIFGRQVVGLLDHLDIDQAVIGGTSLGANVSLEVAVHATDRVKGLVVEMPVLERAAPAAALLFVPMTIGYAQLAGPIGRVAQLVGRIPDSGVLYVDVVRDLLSRDPGPSAAVLHGLLTGRIAPHPNDREKIEQPTLVIGHQHDLLHPFSDAGALGREMRNVELEQASSFFELRFPPNRLSNRICDFLDEVWGTKGIPHDSIGSGVWST